jgi:hypothetical protein
MRVRYGFVALPLIALLLAGCTSSPVGATAAPTRSPATPTALPTLPAKTPTTPPPTQNVSTATPVHLRCKALVHTALARTIAPGLALDTGWKPAPGTPAARLADLDGTVCRWRDIATGDSLEVAVAKPSRSDATDLKNDLVDRSNSVPTYGEEAYFQVVDHIGEVNAFHGRTWVLARSNRFYEPGDATSVVNSVNTLLGGGRTPSPTATATPGATPGTIPATTPAPTTG